MKHNMTKILLASAALLAVAASAEAQPFGGRGGHDRGGHERGGPDRDGGRPPVTMVLRAADANGDNTITRGEVESLQAEMFAWMDRNNDGYLDVDDQSPINRRLAALREADGEEMGDRGPRRGRGGRGPMSPPPDVDSNEDGRISREEFMAMETRLFDHLDSNEDGSITPDEMDDAVERRQDRRESRRFWWRD